VMLPRINEAVTVLVMDRSVFFNESTVHEVFPSLNPVQLMHLLECLHPDEYIRSSQPASVKSRQPLCADFHPSRCQLMPSSFWHAWRERPEAACFFSSTRQCSYPMSHQPRYDGDREEKRNQKRKNSSYLYKLQLFFVPPHEDGRKSMCGGGAASWGGPLRGSAKKKLVQLSLRFLELHLELWVKGIQNEWERHESKAH